MAAFTEGYSKTYGVAAPNHLGTIISKVIAARMMASDEQRSAAKKAQEQGLSLEDFGITQGYFFKKALVHEFGGEFVDRKKESLKKLINTKRILKSKKKIHVATLNFLRDKVQLNKSQSFAKKFENLIPKAEVVPNTEEEVATVASGTPVKKRNTQSQLLQAVTEIAKSLQSTAASINKTVDKNASIASGVVSMQKNVVVEISRRTDDLGDKLDAISDAINHQTALIAENAQKAKARRVEGSAERTMNTGFTERDDKAYTKINERMFQSTSEKMLSDGLSNARTNPTEDVPEAEGGATIISGSDRGYKAMTPQGTPFTAHGTEAMISSEGGTQVVPLDNRATDGIVGNEVTSGTKELYPNREGGGNVETIKSGSDPWNQTVATTSFVDIGNLTKSSPSSEKRKSGVQDAIDAMEIAYNVAGGTLFDSIIRFKAEAGSLDPKVEARTDQTLRALAPAFGLTGSTVLKGSEAVAYASRSSSKHGGPPPLPPIEEKRKNKGLVGKTMDLFKGLWDTIRGKGKDPNVKPETNVSPTSYSKGQIHAAKVMYRQARERGLGHEAAIALVAQIGRETSLDIDLILGTHDDGGVLAHGGISWQGGREEVLFQALRDRGIEGSVEGLKNSGDEGLRANVDAMVNEIKGGGPQYAEIDKLLKKDNLSIEEQRTLHRLFKEVYIRYDKTIPLSRSHKWSGHVEKMLQSSSQLFGPNHTSQNNLFTSNQVDPSGLGYVPGVDDNMAAVEILNIPLENKSAYTTQLAREGSNSVEGNDDALGLQNLYANQQTHLVNWT